MAAPVDPNFEIKKMQVLELVKAKNCNDAEYIKSVAVNYATMFSILLEYTKTFDCDPLHLAALLAIFPDAKLLEYDVYFNKTGVVISNAVFVVNCTNVSLAFSDNSVHKEVYIFNASKINIISVQGETVINFISVGGGSVVDFIKIETGSCVKSVLIKACDIHISQVKKITETTCGLEVFVDDLAVFGGYECLNNNPLP